MSVSGRELSRSRVKRRLDEDPSSWQGCRGDGEERRVTRHRQHPDVHDVAPSSTKSNSLYQLPPTDNDGPTMPMPLVEIKTEPDRSRPTRIINKLNKHNTDVQQQDQLHQYQHYYHHHQHQQQQQQSVQGGGDGSTPGSCLFSVDPGVGDEQVRQMLGFSVDVSRTIDAAGWTCEMDVWRSVVQIGSPDLLGFFDAIDYEDTALGLVTMAVERLVRREALLLVIDHMPGKDEAHSGNAVVDNAKTVKLVAILIGCILEIWQLQKSVDPSLLARIAIVLRGE
ncbi:unnamed protein product [Vitrella brassicaformis CCMP3155]|uniref:Uncharacterized protein n=1 Tax=Vitrella brassicaformis (strain CCMP3155) TaxID=1169540 RepID=A0A0G4EY12_VITBC|nr:unnamed protein product [Vitrella brassicaformis CCMP3155]|eukprot:CEM03514.1 unnamed protein product [Vitrella brassicaformis CCMP3155]